MTTHASGWPSNVVCGHGLFANFSHQQEMVPQLQKDAHPARVLCFGITGVIAANGRADSGLSLNKKQP
ncbi:MAG: hypothetical protein OXC91_15510, partial [Rhodobacteraceae bacterium]|nr:hypothetical protein [Paracoccaceae bacterium]